MNYNPQNEQGLMGLLAALKGGMDPGTAYGVYGDIQNSQMTAVANRQERLGGLAELLMNAAGSGQTYEGASALAEAAPGPAGPAVQQMLSALYPTADEVAPRNANGAIMDFPQGSRPGTPLGEAYGASGFPGANPVGPDYGMGASAMSPVYQPPQPSVSEQLAMEQAATEQQTAQQDAANWAQVTAQFSAAKAQNLTPEQAYAKMAAVPEYAALFGQNPEMVADIMTNTFGAMPVAQTGMGV